MDKKDWTLYILAWVVVVGFYLLCTILIFRPVPESSNEVVFMLFGAIASAFGAVIQYFFGSSKGSADKTKMLTDREPEKPKV